MKLLYKSLAAVAITSCLWVSSAMINPVTESYGSDFNPPGSKASSFHVPAYLSDNEEFTQLEKQLQRFMRREVLEGASVAVARDGKLVYAKGFGYADKESGIVVEPHHLFRIASVSKLITAAGIMRLQEQGRVSLDDKVFGADGILNDSIYLNYRDKRVEDITVRHLLEHSGGWTTRWGDQMFMPTIVASSLNKSLPVSKNDIIRFVLNKRLHFTPGESSYYSNLGYMILGEVISHASGMDYEKYIQTNLLYPLGIFDMRIGGSHLHERAELEVKYYEPTPTFMVADHTGAEGEVLRTYGGNDMYALGAAGGWIASSTDLMKLMLSIDGFDSYPDFLSAESIQTMVDDESNKYGPLGWRRIRSNTWFRTGTLAGTSALMARQENGISYVVLFNTGSWKGPALANDIARVMDRGLDAVENWPDYNLFQMDNTWASTRKRPQVIY
ncbi:beta-lactamase family protein [Carboxylicivirga sediminis]|uniref:Beta-lactamase family protein n=1 Tax=Carboxylicivirga sediminis TaxID=2006564 RepID=A0A941F3C8_9BACT|nr:serine hydrolase domain-containing protein [Carboxylicivirga sediminis]MBR8535174.1 beta-lactamase family protein [Carboxylicivirga sediminis]